MLVCSRRRGRGCARRFAVLALIVAFAGSGCGGSTSSPPTRSGASAGPAASASMSTAPTRDQAKHKTRRRPRPARACGAPSDVLAGIYHPYRLRVLSPCQAVSGTVVKVRHEEDGDLHIDLDTRGALINAVNTAEQGGDLVVEFMPRDGGHLA